MTPLEQSLNEQLKEANEVIKRLTRELAGRWPKCTCHHCWIEPTEASAPTCLFAEAWQAARDNHQAALTEQRALKAKLMGDYPHDDCYVGSREPGKRFD